MKERERILLALERDGLTLTGLRRRGLPIPSEEERLDDKVLIRAAARRLLNLTSEETVEKGVVEVAKAAKAMQQSGISLIPKPTFAVTDRDGIPRLDLVDVVRIVLRSVEEDET